MGTTALWRCELDISTGFRPDPQGKNYTILVGDPFSRFHHFCRMASLLAGSQRDRLRVTYPVKLRKIGSHTNDSMQKPRVKKPSNVSEIPFSILRCYYGETQFFKYILTRLVVQSKTFFYLKYCALPFYGLCLKECSRIIF